MGIKNRLIIMSFLQFGSLVDYHCKLLVWYKSWDGTQFGLVFFGTINCIFIHANINWNCADRINAEKIIRSITHFICWGLFYIPQVATPETFIYIMLLAMCFICLL
jgi:NHS family xanthosine MFS transporter